MWSLLETDTLKKTRRSLLVTAMATIFFASLKITSSRVNFIGLELEISQPHIIKLGQWATTYLLFVFSLQLAPKAAEFVGWIWEKVIRYNERKAWGTYSDDWGPDEGYEEEPYGPDYEAKLIRAKYDQERKLKTNWVDSSSFASDAIGEIVVFLIVPIALGLLAVFYPLVLNSLFVAANI